MHDQVLIMGKKKETVFNAGCVIHSALFILKQIELKIFFDPLGSFRCLIDLTCIII